MDNFFAACTSLIPGGDDNDEEDEEDDVDRGQEHVFAFYDELDEEEREILDEDFDSIDVEKMEHAFMAAMDNLDHSDDMHMYECPKILNFRSKKTPAAMPGANVCMQYNTADKIVKTWRIGGFELYHKQLVSIVILAGGMDARLGDGVPKGALDIGLISTKSIFQLYAERIRRLQHLIHRLFKKVCFIPVYIMCNKMNYELIDDFWRENDFFGMREQDVLFFIQSYAPIMDKKGKFLMASRYQMQKFPNGNGGVFTALNSEGMIADMKSRGVKFCYMCTIDNVLAKVGDPTFLGFQMVMRSDVGVKTIQKLEPEEPLGLLLTKRIEHRFDVDNDGDKDIVLKYKAHVVEFFEMEDDSKKKTCGFELEFSHGNLSQYFFKIEFVMKCANAMGKDGKGWHAIEKAIPYVDTVTGEMIQPEEKNAFRLEMFIMDAFDLVSKVVALQVGREELALVKSSSGPNSPATALTAVGKLHQKWIEAAGGTFDTQTKSTDREDMKCEISPLVSYEGEDLHGQFPTLIRLPFYLPSRNEAITHTSQAIHTRRDSVHYLDWTSDLAQYELLHEIHGVLGGVMESITDKDKVEYSGATARNDELLPPTPRAGSVAERKSVKDGGRPSDGGAASPRASKADDAAKGASPSGGAASPRTSKKKGQEPESPGLSPKGKAKSKARAQDRKETTGQGDVAIVLLEDSATDHGGQTLKPDTKRRLSASFWQDDAAE